jgi:hypothetical protein
MLNIGAILARSTIARTNVGSVSLAPSGPGRDLALR